MVYKPPQAVRVTVRCVCSGSPRNGEPRLLSYAYRGDLLPVLTFLSCSRARGFAPRDLSLSCQSRRVREDGRSRRAGAALPSVLAPGSALGFRPPDCPILRPGHPAVYRLASAIPTVALLLRRLTLLANSLAPSTSSLASLVQLPIPAGEDLSVAAFQLVRRGHVSDGTVKPNRVVVSDVLAD